MSETSVQNSVLSDVKITNIDQLRYRLTGTPWGDRECGAKLFAGLSELAGQTVKASRVSIQMAAAIGTYEDSLDDRSESHFAGARGQKRELRLAELIADNSQSATTLMSIVSSHQTPIAAPSALTL